MFSYLGEYSFFFELFSHFRVQYLLLFSLSALLFLVLWNKKWLIVSIVGLLLNVFPVVSLYFPAETKSKENAHTLSVLLSNVLSSNHRYYLLLNEIETIKPDFVIVLELSPQWAGALKPIESDYPYNKVIPRNDNFGIALYSKHPLSDIEIYDFAQNNIPTISAKYQINKHENKYLQIIATHPLPPINASLAKQQKVHLESLAEYINKQQANKNTSILLAGDLNSTPWSPHYKNLLRQTHLSNTRQGFGIYPTWPTSLNTPLLQIPLDHVLVSKHIHTTVFKTLQSIGSDHLPVFVTLKID